ncbi:serine/threonine-protein kinase [Thermoactinospora rubra]|uniref:serine/threonine-protein kinase n=1 Tax=Thermoactinospora rubra TaxID=1088767 RepID=UPI000A110DFC|nr:serine/threonine-protein kinase [Thermoactinospora rubra]
MSADRVLSGPNAQGGAPSSPGRLVGGRYRLMSPVGRGGMGMVWHAHDVLLDRDVAVKELILPHGLDQTGKQVAHRRMLREARSAARLSHPGIVTVHDVVEEDGRPWIVMELVRAWSLEQAVRQSGPLPVIQAAEIGVRVLDALRHAHAAGILHRDIKPGNVLLTSDRVVLTDFGIAAIEGDVTITQTGLLMGSPAYIPPERLSGQPLTAAADLWSFGATLYAAVEGRPPYAGADAIAVLGAVLTQDPIKPQRAGALLPVIEGLLRKNPADRLTAAQVAELLERVLRSHGSPTRPARDALPTAGNSTPLGLLPPLDTPSGPMPSRIVETPSGPVRVPYDPSSSPSGAQPQYPAAPAGYDALAGPSGSHPTDQLAGPSGGHRADPLTGPSGAPRAGSSVSYDALRSPSGGFDAPPGSSVSYDALRSGSGPVTPGPVSSGPIASGPVSPGSGTPPQAPKPQPILPLTADVRSASGGTPWPAEPDGEPGRTARRPATGRRRAEDGRADEPDEEKGGAWLRDGRPTPRLLVAGAAALGAAALAVVLLTPGGEPEPTGATTAATAPASPQQQVLPLAPEVPQGYKEHTTEGFIAAVPTAWKLTTANGEATFTGPKDSGMKIVVATADPQPDGGLATLTKEQPNVGVENYAQVQLQGVTYQAWKAADWEYTYTVGQDVPMHALVRYVTIDDARAFKITIVMPDLKWDDQAGLRKVFFDTFRPAS